MFSIILWGLYVLACLYLGYLAHIGRKSVILWTLAAFVFSPLFVYPVFFAYLFLNKK